MQKLTSSKTVKRSKIMSSDAFYFVFKGEPMLDEINLDEALAFEDAYPGAILIKVEPIPKDYRVVVFFETPSWTHTLELSKYCYLNINKSESSVEYSMVNEYSGAPKVVMTGTSEIKLSPNKLKYICINNNPGTRIYLSNIKALH